MDYKYNGFRYTVKNVISKLRKKDLGNRKKYLPCLKMQDFVVINSYIGFCCADFGRNKSPGFSIMENGVDNIKQYLEIRERIFAELNGEERINLLETCLGCRDLKVNDTDEGYLPQSIRYMNFSYSPTVCNSKCIYCVGKNKPDETKQAAVYQKFAGILNYLSDNNLLAKDFSIQVSSGEITVHPEREQLISLFSKYICHWYTDAFIFNQQIADNIKEQPKSYVRISVDAGTSRTYKNIKGFDLFDKVVSNCLEYRKHGKVDIKYIVIAGINDSIEDFYGIIDILKNLNNNSLSISRDSNFCIATLPEETLESVALLVDLCNKSDINAQITYVFTPEQIDKIQTIIENGIDLIGYESNPFRQKFRNTEFTQESYNKIYRNRDNVMVE